ncbi:diguanylate cyclase domain-containing protein [sulfur-oxidizing endosymbiont of Gigantopelta aegis]|uniref:diguanylate cyclase domain-containing protein n=1 Tax=sulfur-oxidizing endosymbiont of Gigantopelta aegis TaxID=2794934 RepID=UPI0018DDF4E6|nr:diguanylate cyclase [sulfur-oxidizing endosymbiont of Gigantopelta aegis]
MHLDSKKAKNYLFFSFIFIIALSIVSNIIGFKHLKSVQNDINKIIETQNTQISYMHEMRSLSRERLIKLQAISDEIDAFKQDEIISEFHELGSLFLETRELLMATDLTKEEKNLLIIQREVAKDIVASQYQVIKLAGSGKNKEASYFLKNDTIPKQNENISLMDQFILYQNHQYQFLKTEAQKKNDSAFQTVIIISILALLLTIIIAIIIIKKISALFDLQTESIALHKGTETHLKKTQLLIENKIKHCQQELQKANSALTHDSSHDPLTHLPNRRLFYELLNQEINRANRNHYMLAVLYMNLDDMHTINNLVGEKLGDAFIVNIAKRLKNSLRKDDLLAHLGDDEFALCYSNVKSIEDIVLLCEILINKIKQPMHLDQQCQTSICIGVSIYPDHGHDHDSLMKKANNAMRQVKKEGKNNFSITE